MHMHMRTYQVVHGSLVLASLALSAAKSPVTIINDEMSVAPGVDSLHAAFEMRRRMGVTAPNAIVLEGGMHTVTRPLPLGYEDGGAMVAGLAGATISGGVEVFNWKRQSEPIAARGTTSGIVWEADIPEQGNMTSLGNRLQLWRGTTRLTCAQSPVLHYTNATTTQFIYNPNDVKDSYYEQTDVLLVLYESWTASFNRIGMIQNKNNTIQLKVPWPSKWANTASGSRYYIQNALEELDEVGEFYFDVPKGKILLVTNSTDDPNTGSPVYMPTQLELISLAGNASHPVQNMSWTGMIFAHTSVENEPILEGASMQSGDFLTNAMIHINNATGITFTNCTFRASGGYGFWADYGSYNVRVMKSYFDDLGAGAVRLGRGHTATGPECEGHEVSDNILQNGGFIWQEGCGVFAQNIANTSITHNEIGYFKYTGVSVGWTWGYAATFVHDVITSFNHIHNIGQGFLSDMGCVYTLGHQEGSKIQNNFCSDVQSWNYGGWGYYADEGSRDEVFENNIATRTKCGGFHQHYGTDNQIQNNIFYDVDIGDVPTPGRKEILMKGPCDSAIRGSTHFRNIETCHPDKKPKANCCCYPGCDQGKCASFNFERNIVFIPKGSNSTFTAGTWAHGLDNMTFNDNVYFSGSKTSSDPMFNITETFSEWNAHGKDMASKVTDPQFTSSTNFTLSSTSPALKLGFKPISTATIGPRVDAAGASADRMTPTGLNNEPLLQAGLAEIV